MLVALSLLIGEARLNCFALFIQLGTIYFIRINTYIHINVFQPLKFCCIVVLIFCVFSLLILNRSHIISHGVHA